MRLFINSKFENVPEEVRTLSELIEYLKIKKEGTGVGINGRLIPSREWNTVPLKEEDRIIIITAAYGG